MVKVRAAMSTAVGIWLIMNEPEEDQRNRKFFFFIQDAESIILFTNKRVLCCAAMVGRYELLVNKRGKRFLSGMKT